MNDDTYKVLQEINRKLGVTMTLLARSLVLSEASSLKDQIRMLDESGLRIPEIAQILNKKPGHISKELTLMRKAK